jgi:hypothetical protein
MDGANQATRSGMARDCLTNKKNAKNEKFRIYVFFIRFGQVLDWLELRCFVRICYSTRLHCKSVTMKRQMYAQKLQDCFFASFKKSILQ